MPAAVKDRSLRQLHGVFAAIRRLCPDLPVLAIAWMHIKHPLHPVQKNLLESQSEPRRSIYGTFWTLTIAASRCIAYGLYLGFRIAQAKRMLRSEIETLRSQRFDVVLKTWGFSTELAAKSSDFYYGDLQQKFSDQGMRAIALCGNAGSLPTTPFAKAYTSTQNPARLYEYALIDASNPLDMAFQQIKALFRLFSILYKARNPLLREALWASTQGVLDSQTTRDALHYTVSAAAVRCWNPSIYMTLYEGHGWEKCAWWGAKSAKPSCLTVGYQHTVLFPEALAMLQPSIDIRARSLPDRVLSIGTIPRDLLKPTHEPHACALSVLGSFRYQASTITMPSAADRPWILVTPEGLPDEMIGLFDFTYRAAKAIPEATFVIRTHPAAPLETVLAQLPADFLKIPNILVSKEKDIAADFQRCSFLLYRGSSTVLYAILQGLRPIYLQIPGKIDTDPLYNLNLWRLQGVSEGDLAGIITQESHLNPAKREADWQEARDYISRYTMPFQIEGLQNLKS
jgi:hypothetical protein